MRRVLTTGAANIVWPRYPASGPSKAVTTAAQQTVTAPSRADPTEASGPKTRERSDSEREATTKLKLTTQAGSGDLSRFSPRFDRKFFGEALNQIFGKQDVGISEFHST